MLVDVYERIAEGMEPVAYWLLPNGWLVNTRPRVEGGSVHSAWFIEEGFGALDRCIRRLDWRTMAPDGEIVHGETTEKLLGDEMLRWVNGVYITRDKGE